MTLAMGAFPDAFKIHIFKMTDPVILKTHEADNANIIFNSVFCSVMRSVLSVSERQPLL